MSYAERVAQLMHEPSTDAGDDANRRRRVEATREEMMRQGEAIRRTVETETPRFGAIADLVRRKGLARVVILGCGDSLGIGLACRAAFEKLLRVPTEAAQALDYALYNAEIADERTLVIGISASGKTAAVRDALDRARAHGALTIGLSNAGATALSPHADAMLSVHATRKGWPTQSSTAAIALLCALAAALAERPGAAEAAAIAALRAGIAALPQAMDHAIASLDGQAKALADNVAEASFIQFAGAGPHQAAALFGAAKIKELSPIHAASMPLEEYHHYRTQKEGDLLFLIAPDAASHARALDAALVGRARGGRTIAILPRGEGEIASVVEAAFFMEPIHPDLAPALYSAPLHLFAYHFAMARFSRKLGYAGAAKARAA